MSTSLRFSAARRRLRDFVGGFDGIKLLLEVVSK